MTNQEIAQVILQQLGGAGRLQVMTGAKSIAACDRGVQFKVNGRHPTEGKVSHVRITLTPEDTYTVEYIRVHGGNVKTLDTSEHLYADMLKNDFEHNTQLYLSL